MADTWQRVSIPAICERMIGFSVPRENLILVISFEGMHVVHLGSPTIVETDRAYCEYDLYVPRTGLCRYKDADWEIIGLSPGRPLLTNPQGEWLELDSEASTICVFTGTEEIWSASFENFSGDWAAATFSPDGTYIVLGGPYDFDFRVWERVNG